MSEDATEAVEEWLLAYSTFDGQRREQNVRQVQMSARALALQRMGVIPMHDEPDWIEAAVQQVDTESLRSKALMSGEIPRNSPDGRG